MQDDTMKTKVEYTRTSWVNTERPSKQPSCRLDAYRLLLSVRDKEIQQFLKNLQTESQFWFGAFLTATGFIKQAGKTFNPSDSPLFESHTCTPADHAHCWHTSSSGRSEPLGLFSPGTQLQNHLWGWDRDCMEMSVVTERVENYKSLGIEGGNNNRTTRFKIRVYEWFLRVSVSCFLHAVSHLKGQQGPNGAAL